jgi:MATE family multidrug resistance protein
MSAPGSSRPVLTHRAVLTLAGPAMLANMSGPLIGVVDTAVVGQIPDPAHIGAVAVGSLIFSFVFWAFGVLRMGTTGLTAQAIGAGDERAGLLAAARLSTYWAVPLSRHCCCTLPLGGYCSLSVIMGFGPRSCSAMRREH